MGHRDVQQGGDDKDVNARKVSAIASCVEDGGTHSTLTRVGRVGKLLTLWACQRRRSTRRARAWKLIKRGERRDTCEAIPATQEGKWCDSRERPATFNHQTTHAQPTRKIRLRCRLHRLANTSRRLRRRLHRVDLRHMATGRRNWTNSLRK